jgi:hypothetical protein
MLAFAKTISLNGLCARCKQVGGLSTLAQCRLSNRRRLMQVYRLTNCQITPLRSLRTPRAASEGSRQRKPRQSLGGRRCRGSAPFGDGLIISYLTDKRQTSRLGCFWLTLSHIEPREDFESPSAGWHRGLGLVLLSSGPRLSTSTIGYPLFRDARSS